MNMKQDSFYDAIKQRRSIYSISNEQVVSDERIEEVVKFAVKHTPSAFNSQSGRVVILLGEQHEKLWDLTEKTLRNVVPADQDFAPTEQKMNGFRSGYGTILFFEDEEIVQGLQEKFPLYEDKFPLYSNHSTGMLQYVIWTALEIEGFGASLQHYQPLIDEEVKEQWGIPTQWTLHAQMPFGKPTARPSEKEFQPLDERVKIFK